MRPEPSSLLVPCAGVWLPARGSVQLLLSCWAFSISVGSAAAPLSAQGGALPLPLHCLEAHGEWEELSLSVQLRGGDLLGKLLLSFWLQADLLILGRKAELDTLKRKD